MSWPGQASTADRFEQFHTDNPDLYDWLVRSARSYLQAGNRKVGMQMLIEVARWTKSIQTDTEGFKLDNDFGAFYARLMMCQFPDLDGRITTRRSAEADEWISEIRAVWPPSRGVRA